MYFIAENCSDRVKTMPFEQISELKVAEMW